MHLFNIPGVAGAALPDGAIRGLYRTTGFDPQVRDWHLARLPRMVVAAATFVTCPWCGKSKDTRSLQIDHVIPIRTYIRYRAYPRINTSQCISQHKNARLRMEQWYSDHANLMLCCSKCNASKGGFLPTAREVLQAEQRVTPSVLARRLGLLQADLAAIGNLPTNQHKVNVKSWVLRGAAWSTTARVTRNSSSRYSPYPTMEVEMQSALSEVERLITTFLVKRRLQWITSAAALLPDQPTVQVANENLRVCFYCFGLFKKQAFHIDHINPASSRASTADVYSDARNLIPVCRTCNTSKGDRPLSAEWLDEQIVHRQNEGLPGVEQMTAVPVPTGAIDWETYARAQRLRVLGY